VAAGAVFGVNFGDNNNDPNDVLGDISDIQLPPERPVPAPAAGDAAALAANVAVAAGAPHPAAGGNGGGGGGGGGGGEEVEVEVEVEEVEEVEEGMLLLGCHFSLEIVHQDPEHPLPHHILNKALLITEKFITLPRYDMSLDKRIILINCRKTPDGLIMQHCFNA
jgi:hypothetical protein